ncbi:hypothetical protein FAY30_09050 [Bacillus sp. S3]|uniref:hypothetical protein n=1 Tax=Bacillus sp. S3 TaxID=486398 RepID=UPI001188DD94|nr:hypothetical protein [Bacillus sp. S3]QCJ42033.1 hypothetical protein FAY30_09050 [Bacillus sp. S3]
MEDKQLYFQLLKPIRRQLLRNRIITELHYWLLTVLAFSVLILSAARIVVIPYYHEMIWYGGFFMLLVFVFRCWRSQPGYREAASLFNDYIPDDRVITAFSFIDDDGMLQKLQLAEALTFMKKEQHHVLSRKKHEVRPKWLLMAVLLLGLAILLQYFPNQNLQLAVVKETESKIVKKAVKKLGEKIDKEKNEEKKKALQQAQEIIAKSPELKKAVEELEKQKKELELKALKQKEQLEKLHSLQQELKNMDVSQLAAALNEEDMKKIKKELERFNQKFDSLSESEKQAFSKLSGLNRQLSEKELAELTKKISEALNSENVMNQLADAQAALGEAAESLQTEMLRNGLQPQQVALNSPTQSNGGQTNKQNGKNGSSKTGSQGGGQGKQSAGNGSQGIGNATGSGNGSGQGTGSGNGNGSGQGTGSGKGTGSGSGAGLGQGSRQLLTIPEKAAGKDNLETDTGAIGNGSPSEQYEGNGPILKGQLRSYQEVYGTYAEAYRNSTDRVKLPSDLEEIVKNYFLLLDPNKE